MIMRERLGDDWCRWPLGGSPGRRTNLEAMKRVARQMRFFKRLATAAVAEGIDVEALDRAINRALEA